MARNTYSARSRRSYGKVEDCEQSIIVRVADLIGVPSCPSPLRGSQRGMARVSARGHCCVSFNDQIETSTSSPALPRAFY